MRMEQALFPFLFRLIHEESATPVRIQRNNFFYFFQFLVFIFFILPIKQLMDFKLKNDEINQLLYF